MPITSGATTAGPRRQAPSATGPTNRLAIASTVLGIVWLGGLGSLLALVCGFVAKSQIKRRHEGGGRLATAGIVLGITGLVLVAAYLFLSP